MTMAMSLNSSLIPTHPQLFGAKLKLVGHKRDGVRVFGMKGGDDHGYWHGKIVDENMFVLRERIHEMKVGEEGDEVPREWMDWEKRYYANYGSDVCEAVGLLQGLLLGTRPSLALGVVFAVALSVPTTVGVVLCHLMEIARNIG